MGTKLKDLFKDSRLIAQYILQRRVQAGFYVVDYDPAYRAHAKHIETFLDGHRPATTLVSVPALASPDIKFEIEAYAALRQEPLRKVDVVVVGAGLSGLKAAWEVQKAGFSCIVAEARGRVGGRTYSVDPLEDGRKVDLGGAWINDTNQSEIYKLVQTLGLELIVQKTDGDVIYEDFDGDLSRTGYGLTPDTLVEANAKEMINFITEDIEQACHELNIHDSKAGAAEELDKMTLLEWAQTKTNSKSALAVVQLWTRAMMGIEPSGVSAFFFLKYMKSGGGPARMRSDLKHGGQHLRFLEGSQSVSLRLADLLHADTVMLNSPVFRIKQSSDGVLVSTARGEILCKDVIVSVQTILYNSITFDPSLPSSKPELAKHGVQSFSFKHVILYSEPWWRKAGLSGAFVSFNRPISTSRDTSNDRNGQYSLTGFANGDLGRRSSKYTKAERTKAILDHIERVFGLYV
ncbi:hypothetical protein BDV33DRAFT_206102 [Aspergillus novoparasiticus]|uniref:Amine oxidase n=1 Tax=Aspergillus novoparasiticus TaxID=986946 RepID=A0A5N6EJF8_9EURO|nr:hypothetical protein BDV33DRAFT_206102 [Aspergillus novoparasiticus]